MKDPFHHDTTSQERLAADSHVSAVVTRLQWLKLATGLIALALIGAIWVLWRWG